MLLMQIAEHWMKQKTQPLTKAEQEEWSNCLDVLAEQCWEYQVKQNLLAQAEATRDIDWAREICLDVEKLEMSHRMEW
ncbi:DUF7667 family protein [Paenibacillus sedimenti]|uniref:Uncharacterized protein n=1 Tax=Paenibacillus sedimenti TaxID=2770274 RepID=A0A926QK86_9BACL|nr:hypothetical protein [Paenibacillus sedimenti]MBD0381222.1 hypothetical protein [Paenibacillus sedimenti]